SPAAVGSVNEGAGCPTSTAAALVDSQAPEVRAHSKMARIFFIMRNAKANRPWPAPFPTPTAARSGAQLFNQRQHLACIVRAPDAIDHRLGYAGIALQHALLDGESVRRMHREERPPHPDHHELQ